jgi:hypothetical protein
MKRFMILSLAVLFVTALVPQDLAAGVGIKGGYSLSKFSLTATDAPPFTNLSSPVGGIFFNLKLGPIAIQPEVLYVRMGSRYVVAGSGLEFRFDYIQVPVLLKLSVIPLGPIRPIIYAGGYGSYLFKANGVELLDGAVVGEPVDLMADYEKYDYGVIGGVGIEFKLPGISFSVEGRYNYGLKNIMKNTGPDDFWKNRSMMALVGIGF